jgi:amidase
MLMCDIFQTNCLTEIFVDHALARAKELDDHLLKTGNVLGPLHGLPVSLKDQFTMKGMETIMGALFEICIECLFSTA